MMEMASFAYIHRHDNKALCEKFHPFLNDPFNTYYFCQEFQVIGKSGFESIPLIGLLKSTTIAQSQILIEYKSGRISHID
jgi:hypothetical protein